MNPPPAVAHAHSHAHGHAHGAGAPIPHLAIALAITFVSMGVEVYGGLLSGSLAVLSDAGHMLADAGALVLALLAQVVASRPRTDRRTYGWRRAETLAAFLNGIALGVTAVFIVGEAVARWREPQPIRGSIMLSVAIFGLVANLAAAWVLARAEGNENTRAALAHVMSDAAGSVAAIVAGVLVLALGWTRADSAASVLVAVLVLWSAWRLLRRTASVLLESTPPGLLMTDLERTIRETPGVSELHDLHAWRISDGFDAVTVHVVLDGARHGTEVAREVAGRVRAEHGIAHVTVQPEAPAVASALQVQRPARRR